MNQPCRDEEAVIHMAGTAVIPSTVTTHLGFAIGQAYRALTAWRREEKTGFVQYARGANSGHSKESHYSFF